MSCCLNSINSRQDQGRKELCLVGGCTKWQQSIWQIVQHPVCTWLATPSSMHRLGRFKMQADVLYNTILKPLAFGTRGYHVITT